MTSPWGDDPCDICGKTDGCLSVIGIRFQTKDIHKICSSCLSELNDKIDERVEQDRKAQASFVKDLMTGMKGEAVSTKVSTYENDTSIEDFFITIALIVISLAPWVYLFNDPYPYSLTF